MITIKYFYSFKFLYILLIAFIFNDVLFIDFSFVKATQILTKVSIV